MHYTRIFKYFIFTITVLLSLAVFSQPNASESQIDTTSVDERKKKGLTVLPAVFFSPETSLGFGGAALFYFRNKKHPELRPSSMNGIFIYTLESQILFTNRYNVFLKDEKYWLTGEVGFYIYPYEYYGTGTNIDLDNFDTYTASFIRLELNAMNKMTENLYVGPTLFYDHYFDIDIDKNGILASEGARGIDPSRLFGYGISFAYDRRNNVFSPFKGHYFEGRILHYEAQAIGDFPFTDMYIDARKYFHLGDEWETGLEFYHQSIFGKAPFYNLAQLGGSKLMRGYYKGAYRDKHYTLAQGEIRHYLFSNADAFGGLLNRLVGSAFAGVGTVTDEIGSYDKLLGSYGVGIRYEINSEEHIRIRLDYARGTDKSSGFYININEAF